MEPSGAPEPRLQQQDTGLLPGLQSEADSELPFEEGIAERRKRIDLGLESTRQDDEPVNNVIDLEF